MSKIRKKTRNILTLTTNSYNVYHQKLYILYSSKIRHAQN